MIKRMQRRESAWGIGPAKAAEDRNSEAARPGRGWSSTSQPAAGCANPGPLQVAWHC